MFWINRIGDLLLERNNHDHSVTAKDKKNKKAVLEAYYRKIPADNVFLQAQSKSLTVGGYDCKQLDTASTLGMLYTWLQ